MHVEGHNTRDEILTIWTNAEGKGQWDPITSAQLFTI